MRNAQAPAWWQTPHAWLYAWDFARDCGRFLHLDRETLAQSSFLDQRIAADTVNFDEAPIPKLLNQTVRGTADTPPGFIFHTAFCCSTLLARSLELPGRSLVLREPATLLQLADLKRKLAASPRTVAELLPLTLALLARPFSPTERVVIKPTNVVNNLAPELLASNSDARALVLYDELEPFLLAVLKRPHESDRGIAEFLRRLLADPVGRNWTANHSVPESLAPRAALVWGLQILALRTWCAQEGPDRIRTLRADELLGNPATALARSAAWLGVELADGEAGQIATGALWTRHAKHPEAAYTPSRRREEQALARRLLAEPVQAGIDFAEKNDFAPVADFPAALRLLS